MSAAHTPSGAGAAAVPADAHDPAGADDWSHVEAVVRRSGTSFYWAMRMQPAAKRRAMFAVYAFCREVDDIADEPGEMDVKTARLAEWQRDIDRLYGGQPQSAVARALVGPVAAFGLRKTDFEAILRGMEMDAGESVRIADHDELDLYCDRVACAVGRLSVRVFGAADGIGIRLAGALGRALQLTNILRDLDEDARRDRLYLPADLLRAHGIDDLEDAAAVLRHPRLPEICETIAETAAQCFAQAQALLETCDRRPMRPAIVMMEVYRRTFERLMARGWSRRDQRVGLTHPEKLWVAIRYGML